MIGLKQSGFRIAFCAALLALSSAAPLWSAPPPVKPWTAFGPDGGDARRIIPDPKNPAHLYLGTANGWMYESRDGGGTWSRLAQVGKRDDLVLDSIAVDPTNPRHLVVGAWVIDHPDGGIYFSMDGGISWTNQAEMRGQSVLSLAESASDPQTLVAGTLRGVFRSTDGGARWSRISPEDSTEIHNVQSVAIDPKDPQVIYAGTWHLPWKSVDGGEHWNNIKHGIIEDSDVFSIIVDPDQPKTVFASACSGIYKSEDAGLEFTKIQGIPSSARRTRRLLQDPSNLATVFAGTTEGLFRSVDSGKTWVRTTGPETIVNDVEIDLANSQHVLIATDRGGVLASEDGGNSFHPSNAGFSARQVTAMKRDATHPETIYAGVVNDKDWGGVFESNNGGQSWQQLSDGLQGRDVFALGQAPDGTMIAGTSHGLFLLDQAGATWKRVESAPGVPAKRDSVQDILNRPEVAMSAPPAGNADAAAADPAAAAVIQYSPTAPPAPAKPAARKKPLTKAQLAASKKPLTRAQLAARKTAAPSRTIVAARRPAPTIVPGTGRIFDGSVYAIVTSGDMVVAVTSVGLLTSVDNGTSWSATGPEHSQDWRYLSAARNMVAAASLHSVSASSDGGIVWQQIKLPEQLTMVSAVAIEPNGELWVGGREGVFVSSNAGASWVTPKNLFLSSVNNIFYDDTANRVVITTAGNSSLIFTVRLPDKAVTFADTGWSLRFARTVGDRLIAATLYDGIVAQPRMVASPLSQTRAAAGTATPEAEVAGPVKQPR